MRKQFHHLLGEFWANAAFFMLEIDKGVFPICVLFTHELGPACHIRVRVIFAAEAEIAVIGGKLFWRSDWVGVCRAEWAVNRFSPIQKFITEPSTGTILQNGEQVGQ